MNEFASNQHKFKLAVFHANDPKNFIKFVRKELQLLKSSLPSGIYVKGFEDRMDLYSVMIKGPEKTPYEDGLFFFDFQLPSGIYYRYFYSFEDTAKPYYFSVGPMDIAILLTTKLF